MSEATERFQYFWVAGADTMRGTEELCQRALDGWRIVGVVSDSIGVPKVLMERKVAR